MCVGDASVHIHGASQAAPPGLHVPRVVLPRLYDTSVTHAPADDARAHLHDSPAGGLYAPVVVATLPTATAVSASTATTRVVVKENPKPPMVSV